MSQCVLVRHRMRPTNAYKKTYCVERDELISSGIKRPTSAVFAGSLLYLLALLALLAHYFLYYLTASLRAAASQQVSRGLVLKPKPLCCIAANPLC